MAGLGFINGAGGSVGAATPPPVPALSKVPAASGQPTSNLGFINGGAGSAENPAQVADTSLGKDLGFINQSGDAAAIGQAQHDANSTHQNPILKALSFLDVPRSYAEAALVHGAAALSGQSAELGGKTWLQDAQAHTGLGQYMARIENDPNSNFAKFVGGTAADHKTLNTILGTVGDIGTDPLNYIGIGEVGQAAKVGGKIAEAVGTAQRAEDLGAAAEAARQLGRTDAADLAARAQEAAAKADELTAGGKINTDTFLRFQKQGLGGLNDEEKGLLGVKTGVRVDLPGSKLAAHAGLTSGAKSLHFGAAITDPIQAAVHQAAWHVGNTAFMRGLASKVLPQADLLGQIRDAVKAGEGDEAVRLQNVLRSKSVAVGETHRALNTIGGPIRDALTNIPKEHGDTLRNALEGDTAAQATLDAANVPWRPVADALEHARQYAVDNGVNIEKLDNFFPHQLTEAASAAGKTRSRQAFESELRRTYRAGDDFLGHTLATGSVDEINGIAQQVFGKDAYNLFKSDPHEVLQRYAQGIAHRVGQQKFADHLADLGVTADGDVAHPIAGWMKMMGQEPEAEHMALAGAFKGHMAPDYVREALDNLAGHQAGGAAAKSKLLDYYDRALNSWKAYQLALPGKALRHTVAGPAWASFLGGVGLPAMREGMAAYRSYVKGGLQAVPKAMRGEVDEMVRYGIMHGHNFDARAISDTATSKNPFANNFVLHSKNRELQARGQDMWRAAMYHDARQKGMLPAEAAAKVRQLLGDPHNITDFERATARRVVPFYTFLRQNLPVELKNLATQPQKFVNAYETPKREVEANSPAQSVVPQLFGDTMSIRLPVTIGGNQAYLSPDLPFTRIGDLFAGRNQLAGQTSPVIQDAIAYVTHANPYTGAQFNTAAKTAPTAPVLKQIVEGLAAAHVPGFYRTTADQTDFGQTTPAGTLRVSPESMYILESALPPFSQFRRADSTEPQFAGRQATTILSDLIGQNFRTNDPYQQAGELYRRDAEIKALIEQLQNKGVLPSYLKGFKK